jgi:carbonic anhydrase
MKPLFLAGSVISLTLAVWACSGKPPAPAEAPAAPCESAPAPEVAPAPAPQGSAVAPSPLPGASQALVSTKESQTALTPDAAIQQLKDGHARFMAGRTLPRSYADQVKGTGHGQFPFAAVLSCLDSRVGPEILFDQGIGDVFVARVAGNFVNEDILGSLEYATSVAGAKVIVVMGHSHCGAVKAACDNLKLGHITHLVQEIRPAVTASVGAQCSSKNHEQVEKAAEKNVEFALAELRKSDILKKLEADGKIKIVSAMYDIETGKVSLH